MKRLLTTIVLSLVCCAANAKDEKVISIMCKGVRTLSVYFLKDPKSDVTNSMDAETVYVFKVEKNPANNDALAWTMQTDGAIKQHQQSGLVVNFNISITDQLIFVQEKFRDESLDVNKEMTINRLTGKWLVTEDRHHKISLDTFRTTGMCEAAKPKF